MKGRAKLDCRLPPWTTRLVVAAAALLLAATIVPQRAQAQLAESPWPMFRLNLSHTGASPYAGPQDALLRWKSRASGPVRSSPAIGPDGTVYFGSWDGAVYAVASDGRLEWRYQTQAVVDSSPAIAADGTLYAGSNDCYLYAFRKARASRHAER